MRLTEHCPHPLTQTHLEGSPCNAEHTCDSPSTAHYLQGQIMQIVTVHHACRLAPTKIVRTNIRDMHAHYSLHEIKFSAPIKRESGFANKRTYAEALLPRVWGPLQD